MSQRRLKAKGIFITATDTSVGKTTIAAGLIGYLKRQGFDIGVMKPVASGAIECDTGKLISQDAEMLVKFSGAVDPWEWINPYCLATAVTPALAAKIEGVTIDLDVIRESFSKLSSKHELVIVEGAGGILSPLFEQLVMLDLISLLELPTLIVARSALGTINHTLMTYQCLRARNVEVIGFLLNRFPRNPNLAESTNAELISRVGGVEFLGSIQEMGDFFSQADLIDAFASSIYRDKLLDKILEA
ncbi:MAG: dethiobiotin synthase [Terriglobia bacterium]